MFCGNSSYNEHSEELDEDDARDMDEEEERRRGMVLGPAGPTADDASCFRLSRFLVRLISLSMKYTGLGDTACMEAGDFGGAHEGDSKP